MTDSDKYWVKTDEIVSLKHPGFQERGCQMAIAYLMRPALDMFSAINECK
jgi:hypothetical protein